MDNIKDYIELVKAPWGRMFYDLLFMQLDIPQLPKLKILDFGSGLGVSSNYYGEWHAVTAVEPNQEMIKNSRRENAYEQIHGDIENINEYDNKFDFIFCHNVLEYIENKKPIIIKLLRVLKKEELYLLLNTTVLAGFFTVRFSGMIQKKPPN